MMQQKQVRRLPIIRSEDGRLVGILSMNDLALMEQGGAKAELSAEDVEQTLRGICTHRELPLAERMQQAIAEGNTSRRSHVPGVFPRHFTGRG